DQGPTATSTTSILNKADQGTKSRSETTAESGKTKRINQESQWQIKPTSGPSGEGNNRVNALNSQNQTDLREKTGFPQ
ncbi:hypothetical protein, partial [Flavitalea sp.]|nr:hypothetical protein [Flavitalea sp.]